MKLHTLTLGLALVAVVMTGCVTPEGQPDSTATGALAGGAIGALSGAAIGSDRGRGGEGALIGGAIGAITGGLIGHSIDQEHQERLRQQAPQTYERVDQGQPLATADVKALSQSGVSEDVIISQIRNSRTVFHLSAADIIDLHNAGVSERVVDFMINTPSTVTAEPARVVVADPPPAPRTEVYVAPPGPDFIWIGGEWIWNGGWVWVGGHWGYPPHPHAVWINGYWGRGGRGYYRVGGHWR